MEFLHKAQWTLYNLCNKSTAIWVRGAEDIEQQSLERRYSKGSNGRVARNPRLSIRLRKFRISHLLRYKYIELQPARTNFDIKIVD